MADLIDLQAIEARSIEEQRLKARVGVWVSHPSFYPLSKRTVGQLQEDAAALLSLIREKDQVIERLTADCAKYEHDNEMLRDHLEKALAAKATLKAGQEARELALLQFAAFGFGVNCDEARAALFIENFNAIHSGEKMK